MKLIEDAFEYTSLAVRREYWDSFDEMNKKIISMI